MKQNDYQTLSNDYYRIEQVIRYIEEHYQEQPGLEQLARLVNLSEFHFQRLFKRWVGVSPKRFLQYITKEHAKSLLEDNKGLLETTYRMGLSSPGRLHDLFVQCEAVTPGEYKMSGEGLEIRYGEHPSPFGRCLLAITDRGICGMVFLPERSDESVLSSWREQWKKANFHEDKAETGKLVDRVFSRQKSADNDTLPIYFHGTNFQIKLSPSRNCTRTLAVIFQRVGLL